LKAEALGEQTKAVRIELVKPSLVRLDDAKDKDPLPVLLRTNGETRLCSATRVFVQAMSPARRAMEREVISRRL
jgi:hypothetical protein